MNKMQIVPKNIEEAMEITYNVLNQGDSRYNDPKEEIILSRCILNKIICLEEKKIPFIDPPENDDLSFMGHVQREEKYVAKFLLKKEGFSDKEIFFERGFLGLRPDVFAENKERIVVVECCSCYIHKILDYLPKTGEIWIITRGETPWEDPIFNEKMQLFVFKKGFNWYKFNEIRRSELEELKKVKSPLGTL